MKKIKIDDLRKYKFLSDLKFSPKGNKLCFVVKKAKFDENDYSSDLWIYNLNKEKLWKLTSGENDSNYVWIDNNNIIFTSKRKSNKEEGLKPNTEFYKINLNGGEADFFTEIPYDIKKIKHQSKSLFINVISDIEEKTEKELEKEKNYQILDEIPFWKNGKGFTNKKRSHLIKLNLDSKDYSKIIRGKKDIIDYDILDDKVVLNIKEYSDKMEIESELFLYDLKEDHLEQLTKERLQIGSVKFKNKSTIYFTGTDMKKMGLNTNHKIYKFDLNKSKINIVTNKMDKYLGDSVGNDSRMGGGKVFEFGKDNLYLITTEGYNSYLNVLSEGEIKKIIENDGTVDMFDINNNRIAFIGFRGNKLQELYLYQNQKEKQISEFNKTI